jgi:hypothetical protein
VIEPDAVPYRVPEVGRVTFVVAVDEIVVVKAPLVANVAPLSMVKVPVEEVMVRPLILVAVATPKTGVTNVGEVAKTSAPLPVSPVTAAAKLADDGVAKNVATPAPRPVIVPTGKLVAFARSMAEGVPKSGVTNAAFIAKTATPVPVSFVNDAAS